MVLECFRKSDMNDNGLLTSVELLDCFARLNVVKPSDWAAAAIPRFAGGTMRSLNFQHVLECYAEVADDGAINELFARHADLPPAADGARRRMSRAGLGAFLRAEQRQPADADLDRAWAFVCELSDAGTRRSARARLALLLSPLNAPPRRADQSRRTT